MYEEGVSEYFTAKRMAARRLFGNGGAKTLRHRPHDLPSNGEIQQALLEWAEMNEGDERLDRLFTMRIIAMKAMESLEEFSPALIGSVSTGYIRKGSDIDIHVFTDSIEYLERCIQYMGWKYELKEVQIRKNNTFQTYTHIYVDDRFPIELTVYEPYERRVVQRSSTDGKPIQRVSLQQLKRTIAIDHPDEWDQYNLTQALPYEEMWEQEPAYQTLADQEDESDTEPSEIKFEKSCARW